MKVSLALLVLVLVGPFHVVTAQTRVLHWDWQQNTTPVQLDRANVIDTLVKQGRDRPTAEREADQTMAVLSRPQSRKARIAVLVEDQGYALAFYEGRGEKPVIRLVTVHDERRDLFGRFEVAAGKADGTIGKYEPILNYEEFLGTSLAVPMLTGWSPAVLVSGGRQIRSTGTFDVPASAKRRDGYRIEYTGSEPGWKATAVGRPARVEVEKGGYRVTSSNIENVLARSEDPVPGAIRKLLEDSWQRGGMGGASVQDWRLGDDQVKLYTFENLPTLDELRGLPADPRMFPDPGETQPATSPGSWLARFGVLLLLLSFAYWLGTRRSAPPRAHA